MSNNIYEKKWDYYSHGSNAYDVATAPARQPQIAPKPGRTPRPERAPRQKRQVAESIFVKKGMSLYTFAIIAILFVCAFASVYYGAEVQYNNRQTRLVRTEITETQRQITNTRSIIDGSYNLAEVEVAAERLGLARPQPHQQIRVYIPR